tara:strand:+ start:41 stop:205 length:165 start_codon:yes stop_codon:yes gene_type:complete
MENQNHITILVHNPHKNETHFQQIRGKGKEKHIEGEISLGRERYKRLVKQILTK